MQKVVLEKGYELQQAIIAMAIASLEFHGKKVATIPSLDVSFEEAGLKGVVFEKFIDYIEQNFFVKIGTYVSKLSCIYEVVNKETSLKAA